MPRSSPHCPSRRVDGHSESSEHGGGSEAGGCEEKGTKVAIRARPLNEREKPGKRKKIKIWKCVPTHNLITQVRHGFVNVLISDGCRCQVSHATVHTFSKCTPFTR